jgi:teichuronic acid biosynthesis glycosyltransferase TuaC
MEQMSDPISILMVTTLFPNSIQPSHGVFVETRLRKLLLTGKVTARVLAPVPFVPPPFEYSPYGKLWKVGDRVERDGLIVDHPRYLVLPKIGMNVTPHTLYRAMRKRFLKLRSEGHKFDLVDAHYFYPDGVAAVRLAREFGLPVVVTARGTDLNLIPEFPAPRRMILKAASQADGLITVCQALKDRLVELGIVADAVTVLRNGVDLDRFRPMDRAAARHQMGLTRRTLLSVGHLIERKGHHHVTEALRLLPDTDLLIVGDGVERSTLEQLAKRLNVSDRVKFLGAVDQRSLAPIYNAADALVLASSREGWANVLLEAMACGTPVVASNVWGTPEVVAADEAGQLMPTLDAAGVAAGVEKLFANLPDRAATRHYAEKFDWQSTTEGQLSLFEQILARRGRAV